MGTVSGPNFVSLRAGEVPYATALQLQETLLENRSRTGCDTLVLLQHRPVITLGRGTGTSGLKSSESFLRQCGIDVHQISRGGEATLHNPGQLVGYPIIDLNNYGNDLHRYLRLLEEVLIRTVAGYGISAKRHPGNTGIWVDDQKLASIGVGVRRWVSWHGFALNVCNDLEQFRHIVPCGMPDVRITSLKELGAETVEIATIENDLIKNFGAVFQSRHLGEYEPDTITQTSLA